MCEAFDLGHPWDYRKTLPLRVLTAQLVEFKEYRKLRPNPVELADIAQARVAYANAKKGTDLKELIISDLARDGSDDGAKNQPPSPFLGMNGITPQINPMFSPPPKSKEDTE